MDGPYGSRNVQDYTFGPKKVSEKARANPREIGFSSEFEWGRVQMYIYFQLMDGRYDSRNVQDYTFRPKKVSENITVHIF